MKVNSCPNPTKAVKFACGRWGNCTTWQHRNEARGQDAPEVTTFSSHYAGQNPSTSDEGSVSDSSTLAMWLLCTPSRKTTHCLAHKTRLRELTALYFLPPSLRLQSHSHQRKQVHHVQGSHATWQSPLQPHAERMGTNLLLLQLR